MPLKNCYVRICMNKISKFLKIAHESNLVSDLSFALASRFCQGDFASLMVIMLNFRLEQCADVCLKLDEKIINKKPSRLSFLKTIFASSQDKINLKNPNDDLFIETAQNILKKMANKRESFSLAELVAENLQEFSTYICKEDNLQDTPLVFDEKFERLYFHRYFDYEQYIATFIKSSIIQNTDDENLDDNLNLLFFNDKIEPNYQKIAVRQSYLNKFSVISGGPGTGKTTTVTKLLILLLAKNPKLKIALTAPTGKAASRLHESIVSQKKFILSNQQFLDNLKKIIPTCESEELINALPEEATTVHSLIKIIPHKVIPIYNAHNKLPYDVVLVDEVSMLDLSLFHNLVKALPQNCRLILLGDRNQLSSVEAGAVLAEISNYAITSKQSFFTELQKGYRCNEVISELAKLINADDFLDHYTQLLKTKNSTTWPHICSLFNKNNISFDEEHIITWYKDINSASKLANESLKKNSLNPNAKESFYPFVQYLKEKTQNGTQGLELNEIYKAFELLNYFRILCSNRNGPLGQNILNELISNQVFFEIYNKKRRESDKFFTGQVVMVTQNNQALGLANGDIGFCAPDKNHNNALRIFFEATSTDKERIVNPIFLNDYDLGFAMTVHKSQGSEYNTVALITSLVDNPVLTKELMYTAITRARDKVKLYCSDNIFKIACNRRIKRSGGLGLRLKYD